MEIDNLLSYLEGSLPGEKKEMLEDFLLANPEYFKILKGLSLLMKEYGDRKSVKRYLKSQTKGLDLQKLKNRREHPPQDNRRLKID